MRTRVCEAPTLLSDVSWCPPACTNRSDIGKTVVSLAWTRESRWTRRKRKDSIFHKGHPFDPRSLSFYEESGFLLHVFCLHARFLWILADSTDTQLKQTISCNTPRRLGAPYSICNTSVIEENIRKLKGSK